MWATIGPTVDELPWLYELVHRRLVKSALLCWSSQPLSPQHTISPSIRHDRTVRWFTASTTSEKRVVQSFPLRVMSRMPTESLRHKAIAVVVCAEN